jgi:hypothetical protein
MSTHVALEARIGRRTSRAALVPSDPSPVSRLEVAALASRAAVPAPWRDGVTVEAGRVDQVVERGPDVLMRRGRSYVLITWRGAVLALSARLAPKPPAAWADAGLCDEILGDLPVVLGPSSLLALVEYCLGLVSGAPDAGAQALNPLLSVVESAWCPYPPQSDPVGDCAGRGTRDLVVAGRIRAPRRRTSWGSLLIRPDLWSRPSATQALPDFGCRVVGVSARSRRPERAVVVHSLTALSAGPGVIDLEAGCALADRGAVRRITDAARRVRLDPWRALSRVRGSLGKPRPALSADPISGDRFGMAPAVLTDMTAHEVFGCD